MAAWLLACAHAATKVTFEDPHETRCRAGAPLQRSHDCFAAGSAYDRGAHGHPLRQDLAIELFTLGCRASPDDPSCGALKNEIVSLELAETRRGEALLLLEAMCDAGVKDLCNDLARARLEGIGAPAEPARAVELYERTCRVDGRGSGRANLDAIMVACQEVAGLLRSGVAGVPKDELRAVAADMRASELARQME